MTAADLEAVVARTRHERFRWLTSDANPDAAQRESYRALVARMAGGDSEPKPPPPEPHRASIPLPVVRAAMKIGHRNCLYATRCGCAGGGATCHHLGRVVSIPDCVRCLESLGLISS